MQQQGSALFPYYSTTTASTSESFASSSSTFHGVVGRQEEEPDDDNEFAMRYYRKFGERSIMRSEGRRLLRQLGPGRGKQWNLKHKNYEYSDSSGGCLGEGTYGKVFRAEMKGGTRSPIALKLCCMEFPKDHGLPETVLREITLLRELAGHQNILALGGVSCVLAKEAYLLCELLEMDLLKLMKANAQRGGAKGFRDHEVRWIMRNILKGLAHCHAMGIVHRDLKPVSEGDDDLKVAAAQHIGEKGSI